MLRLVHPAPKGQENTRPKFVRSDVFTPTKAEQDRIRATIRNLSRAYGGRDVLASVMKVPAHTLHNMKRTKTFALAVLLARAAGITVEQILTGKPHEAGSCALCGRKGAR